MFPIIFNASSQTDHTGDKGRILFYSMDVVDRKIQPIVSHTIYPAELVFTIRANKPALHIAELQDYEIQWGSKSACTFILVASGWGLVRAMEKWTDFSRWRQTPAFHRKSLHYSRQPTSGPWYQPFQGARFLSTYIHSHPQTSIHTNLTKRWAFYSWRAASEQPSSSTMIAEALASKNRLLKCLFRQGKLLCLAPTPPAFSF